MIINEIALKVNDMIINLYSSNIKFYQVIIGMFIFDLIIYYIVKMIQEGRRHVYYK